MKRKTFTLAELRKTAEASSIRVQSSHLHKRRKVNCCCRCTPREGIIALHPDDARRIYKEVQKRVLRSDDPGFIADAAIQAGDTLTRSCRPRLALKLMQTALRQLLNVDEDLQRDYESSPDAPNRWYLQERNLPWSSRVSEKEAMQLAVKIDMLNDAICKHLGRSERSYMRYRIHRRYQNLFNDIYECCFDDIYECC